MIKHIELSSPELWRQIKNKQILLGGNANLKIFGTLACKSGKRMKKQNRVFFTSESEAQALGYRPCGHCMRAAYLRWKLDKYSN
jgi:methylphosphotriester-DNA--protein-cysteine methyltransferase